MRSIRGIGFLPLSQKITIYSLLLNSTILHLLLCKELSKNAAINLYAKEESNFRFFV